MGQVLDEFNDILNKKDDIILSIAIELRSALVKLTPVDTGNLKASWSPVKKTDDGYKIENTANYATIALSERIKVDGKLYGSEQNTAGVDPTILFYSELLQERLDKI